MAGRYRRTCWRWSADAWALVALSAWAALLTLFATRHGPGLSPDSVYYLSSGISLADAGQLRQLTGHPMTVFPPGLPALIAIGVWCGVDAETAARIVCVATAAAIVVLGHLLLRQLDLGHRALWTATVLLAGSPVLLAVDRMAWSEPPFIACFLALLTILERSWRRGWFSVLDFSLAVLLCWASFAFRYSGVVSIPASALTILLMLRKRLVHAAIVASSFAVAAASLPIAWMMRNHSIDGTYLGPRDPSTDDLTDVALRIKTVLADWLFPSGPSGVRFAALLVFATLLSAVLVVSAVLEKQDGASASAGQRLPVATLIFTLVYVGYLVVAQLLTRFDPIDSRLLSPTYVPMVALIAVALTAASALHRPQLAPAMRILSVGLALYVAAVACVGVIDSREAAARGVVFNEESLRQSPLANALRGFPDAQLAITNSEFSLYHAWSVARVPRMTWVPAPDALESFATEVACASGPTLLAWFGGPVDPSMQSGVDRHIALILESTHPDGALYRIESDLPASACDEIQ